jgi:prepilin-type N-terminal cleavage/methylation domain-containing protein
MPSAVRRRMGGDAGMTLTELVVSMAIMSVVLAIFMTGVVQFYRLSNATEVKSVAQAQVSLGLLRVAREIPYAAEIGDPYLGASGQSASPGDSVEALITQTATAQQCVRLRVSNGVLQQRTWTYQSPAPNPPLNLTPWTTLATNVSSPRPFRYIPADDTVGYQRLEVRLDATNGAGSNQVTRQSAVTFTALNTTRAARSGRCTEGRNLA